MRKNCSWRCLIKSKHLLSNFRIGGKNEFSNKQDVRKKLFVDFPWQPFQLLRWYPDEYPAQDGKKNS